MAFAVPRGDWRDGAAYDRLLAGDRRCFAWEWQRRSIAYSNAWTAGAREPGKFGLLAFVDPGLDALAARPFWRRGVDPAVLCLTAGTAAHNDMLDLEPLVPLLSVLSGRRGQAMEHILLSDGLRSIRVDVLSGSLAGPVDPSWRIDGMARGGPPTLALRQLIALAGTGRFARSLHRPERRARRWVAMLRAHDAIAAGAGHRELVETLFGVDAGGPRWRDAAGPWRLRAQRLSAGARTWLARGPTAWLGGDEP